MMRNINLLKPVKHQKGPLYEDVATQLEALIKSGNLKAGDQLPPEREMVNIFGVSRTCIREAVKSLSARGLISIEHGKGVFVRELTNVKDNVEQLWKQILWEDPEDMKGLFEIRKLLEPQGSLWAAQRSTVEEAQEIAGLVDSLLNKDEAELNVIKLWEYDTKFHVSIAKATHNPVYLRIIESILDLMADARKYTFQVEGRPLKSVKEHELIAEAILKKDEALAWQHMMHHLNNVEKEIFSTKE